jgi:gamma-glutamylputrescine oxidase
MPTYYHATIDPALRFAPLAGRTDADIVIIGGGFAGLATAFSLMERGVRDCVLLEAQTIGHGASGRNGGFVFGGFSLDTADLVKQLGRDEARRLYQLTQDAVNRIRARIDEHRIDCDAVYGGALLANWFAGDKPLLETQRFMRETFGIDWRWVSRDEMRALLLSERYHAGLFESNAFHFNPLKYALGEARVLQQRGVRVHEQTRVRAIVADGSGWRVDAGAGSVHCRHVVVSCGGYLDGLVAPLARATMPIATYVMTTEPLHERLRSALRTDAAVYDTRFAFDYYRPLPDTRLLWGSRISIRERKPADVSRLLLGDLLRVYPQLRGVQVTHAWSGLMSYARHKMPQVGRLPNGLWYAMGFGGHGVAPTTLAGVVLAQALTGEAEIPRSLAAYGLAPTYGALGRLAAQATYWWMQGRDALRERR